MYTKSIAAVAALASVAAAAPKPVTIEQLRSGFSVSQIATGNKVVKNGPLALSKAYSKYNGKIPSHVAAAAAAQQTGSVVANGEEGDAEYVCEVSIGDGNTLNLDFDTGSADLWVFGSDLDSSSKSGHSVYQPSGEAEDGYSWEISYGDGSGASGNVYLDTVVIGGVTATSQAVEVATTLTASQQQPTPFSGSDGLVGLAFSTINTVKPKAQKTFFDTVADSLPSQLFTATLKSGEPGSYDFGYLDDSKYTGDITYADVDNSQGFWQFTADGASAGGSSVASSFSAIADTGTTLVLLDDDVVSAYYQTVDGAENDESQGGWTFPCDTTPTDFVISINGYDATIPGKYINFASAGSTCFGGIQSNSGIGFSILGDVFLKSQYAVFDASVPQVGFAAQA